MDAPAARGLRPRPVVATLLGMRLPSMIPLAGALLAVAAGCGSGGGGPAFACNYASEGLCVELVGSAADVVSAGGTPAACTQGTFLVGWFGTSVSSCSSNNRVGRCTKQVGGGLGEVTMTYHYYPPNYSAASAPGYCASSGGTFVPE